MRHADLRISYRDGRPRVGYLYLSDPKEKSAHSTRVEPGMVLDFNKTGQLIGIEFLAPKMVTLDGINAVLKEYGLEPFKESELKPLLAA
jgi:uncharacterized protein YuzE